MKNNPLITQVERQFKTQSLDDLRNFSTRAATLRRTVNALFNFGIPRKTLVEWGVEAGYTLAYMRSLISKLLCSQGLRGRKTGAGRPPSPKAHAIADSVVAQYGLEHADKLLRAAARIAKARAETQIARRQRLYCGQQLAVAIFDAGANNPPLAPSLVARASETLPLPVRNGREEADPVSGQRGKALPLPVRNERGESRGEGLVLTTVTTQNPQPVNA